MMRNLFILIGLALVTNYPLLAQVSSSGSPAAKKVEFPRYEPQSNTPTMIKNLQEEVDPRDFQSLKTLKDGLEFLHEKFAAKGKELTFLTDEDAFLAEMVKGKPNLKLEEARGGFPGVLESRILFPTLPKRVTAACILESMLSQVPNQNAAYLFRKGHVFITTKNKACIKSLLREKVFAHFHQKSLMEAIYLLSDFTGASIIIDNRIGEKALTPVTATFTHDTTLESALTILADMSDLKMVLVGEGIYVTTPGNAEKLTNSTKK